MTYQQVQKYEKGTNRISASVLYEISGALKIEPGYFFEGLPSPTHANLKNDILPLGRYENFLATKDGIAVVEALTKLRGNSRKILFRHIVEVANTRPKRRLDRSQKLPRAARDVR